MEIKVIFKNLIWWQSENSLLGVIFEQTESTSFIYYATLLISWNLML